MLEQLWPFLGIAIALIPLYLALHRSFLSPLSRLPGPLRSKFTDLWLMKHEFSGTRRLYIHELHRKYGPVVRLGPNEAAFTSLDALKTIYSEGGSGFDKSEFYTLFMQLGARTMFSTLEKSKHSKKKRHIAGQYANTNIMRPQVLGGIQERVDAFVRECHESKGQSLDAYVYLHCYALDCASHHLFHPYGTHSIEGGEDMRLLEELSYHDSLKDHWAQYRWPTLSNLFSGLVKTRPSPLSNQYVIQSCKNVDPSKHSLLHALQNSKGSFSQLEIAAECMDHLAAGIDTTGDALCFLMYQLSLPDSISIQNKLFCELVGNDQNREVLDDLPYLNAVVKEGLRCFPPIPMSQPRCVPPGGRTIDGYYVPYDTIVSCQAWSVHRLNGDIYPDGDTFKPERWLDGEVTLDMNRGSFAFGVGGRGCTGRHLAIAEMKLLLCGIYSQFRTRLAADMKGSMALSDQIISSRPLGQVCRLLFEKRTGR